MGGLKPTRRTLVKGAAWSVPVVAMGATAATAAASPNSVTLTFIGGCKLPGGSCAGDPPWYTTKGYLFVFAYNNYNSCDVITTGGTITQLSGDFPSGGLAVQTGVVIAPGEGTIAIAGESNNSRDLSFSASMTVEWALDCNGDGEPDTSDRYTSPAVTVSVDETRPCVNCDLPPEDETSIPEEPAAQPAETTADEALAVEEPVQNAIEPEPAQSPSGATDAATSAESATDDSGVGVQESGTQQADTETATTLSEDD